MPSVGLKSLYIVLSVVSISLGYKHVVFMHGILAGPEEWPLFAHLIQKYHPGTPTTIINMYNYRDTLCPLWTQVDGIAKNITPILTNKSSEGTILICFSQGSLICRGLLSVLRHNVDTFISISGPLAGQFGDTDYLRNLFPHFLRDKLYEIFYRTITQEKLSIANYWYDPHHIDRYAKYSAYLGKINNQTSQPNPHVNEWRSNFLKLKKMVLVGGPNDGVITPWQSSQFGMYNSNMDILPMTQQPFYIQDSFGLKTLNEKGAVHVKTIPGIQHINWHVNPMIFDCCIKPWLS